MKSLSQVKLDKAHIAWQIAQSKLADLQRQTIAKEQLFRHQKKIDDLIEHKLKTLSKQWGAWLNDNLVNSAHSVHRHFSEILDDWLNDLADQIIADCQQKHLAQSFSRALRPIIRLTVSQWAEAHRYILSGTNLPGRWQNQAAPHAVEIMDSLSAHSPVRSVTFMKASGVSGTEIELNWLGYILNHLSQDVMLVVPTIELRDRSFHAKIQRLIKDTPVLAEVASQASRDDSNRKDLQVINGARLVKSGANSADSLRAEHLPYVVADELDAFPLDVGGEGDPISLINNRQKTFSRAKSFFVSTPAHRGFSLIEKLFKAGDQRYRYVPCPHCGHAQRLEFKHFHWEIDDRRFELGIKEVTRAWFECPSCKQVISESEKDAMLDKGEWRATNPTNGKHRSYHLNAFYAKFGLGEGWVVIAQRWLDAQGDSEKLKTFINTYLGETTDYEGEGVEASPLLARLEEFDDIDDAVRTAGVDVQQDRLELTIYDWHTNNEEAWAQTHLIIEGDTLQEYCWEQLANQLSAWKVDSCAIDSGFRADRVYSFCEGKRWVVPIKGLAGMSRPLIEDEIKRKQRLRRRRKRGQAPEPIGVDQGKAILYSRLKMSAPKIDESGRAGYIHFKNCAEFDEEFFLQLTAEKLTTKKRSGREYKEWVKTRARNEALDCYIYALIALRLNVKRSRNVNSEQSVRKERPGREQPWLFPTDNSIERTARRVR